MIIYKTTKKIHIMFTNMYLLDTYRGVERAQEEKDIKKMTIADTIYDQLGANKFMTMTGAKWFEGHKNGLSFKIGKNRTQTNHVIINLNEANDDYTMIFERVSIDKKTFECKQKIIAKKEGVYADMLQTIFADVTGLYTSL